MQKLVKINQRKQSLIAPSLSLPSLKRQYQIPLYEDSNNIIAKKIINSKSSLNIQNQLKLYRTQ